MVRLILVCCVALSFVSCEEKARQKSDFEAKTASGKCVGDKRFIQALIAVESNGNPNAVSSKGCRGLMQLKESTWDWVCHDVMHQKEPWSFLDAFDPVKNRAVGESYVKWLITYWNDNRMRGMQCTQTDAVVASYNCGQGRVLKSKGDLSTLPTETVAYIGKVKKVVADGK